MPELMTAIYHSKSICIFDILDNNGQYVEKIRSEYRRASQANELFCPECQGTLELCAGAIVAPYFRHKSINDCPTSREMKTEAGKRMYQGKKMLYSLGRTVQSGEVVVQEGGKDLPYHPVIVTINDIIEAFLYLDGNSRNYEELRRAQKNYEDKGITTYWFLHKKYQSNSKNLTSNEAEVAELNNGILYYLDMENQKMDFRKAYQSPYGDRRYYSKTISMGDLVVDSNGEFNQDFLSDYEAHVRRESLALDRILRVPIEEGLDEQYFDFSYSYMDAIGEIWVLPELEMALEEHEFNERAKRQREDYVTRCNTMLLQIPMEQREWKAAELFEYVNRRGKVSNWLG